MKTVIFYSSKGGCSKECAEILKNFMGKDAIIADVAEQAPDISSFDFVVLGGGVRFGKFYPQMQSFIANHKDEIEKKPYALFLCCGFMDMADEYIEKLYPLSLRQNARFIEYFGGELKPEKHSGFMKFVVRWIRNSIADREEDNDLPDIIESNISLLATKILAMKKDLER